MADCEVIKIDSNISELRYAEEECIGVLPDSGVVWNPLEPNSYNDFGAQLTLTPRNPINSSRQRKKGSITDLAATGVFVQDLTQTNSQDLLQGFVFADTRTKAAYNVTGASADLTITVTSGELPKLNSTDLDFTTLGLTPGEWIYIGDGTAANSFATAVNNGFKRVRVITAHSITLDKSDEDMVADVGTGKTVKIYMGKVLKNELGSLIKRRSYQLERTLGSLDGLDPPQSEYLIGAVPSQLELAMATSAYAVSTYTFTAIDVELRSQVDGLKTGTRPALVEIDAFNTSSDLSRIRLALASGSDVAPPPLFNFATDLNLTINNNLSAAKALGRLGAVDVSAGTFQVSGTITAYFTDISAVQAVRNNADVTLDMVLVKGTSGIVMDIPLIALGNGLLNVTLDQPITLPLTADAATGAKVDPNLDHTICFTFFDNLPEGAAG